jgi:hypothetical protein
MPSNVKLQIQTAEKLLKLGFFPYVPLLTHFLEIYTEFQCNWLEMDFVFLKTCDAVLRLQNVDKEGNVRSQVIKNDDEYILLKEVNHLFERCHNLGFWMCGHNIKNFDIPVMIKRMMINGIEPSKLLPRHDTKPWEVKALDTLEIWRAGNPWGLASLELMCAAMGVESSKEGEVTGNRVHDAYWLDNMLDAIADYCERDVLVLVKLIDKLKKLR